MNVQNMKMTPAEQEVLDWCRLALSEEQICACEEEACEIAGVELNQDEAADSLVKLYTGLLIRHVRSGRAAGGRKGNGVFD